MLETIHKSFEIMGVSFNNISFGKSIQTINNYFGKTKFHHIVTANTEIVMAASKDKKLSRIIQEADLTVADGIGVVWASKIMKDPLPERIAGVDLVKGLLSQKKPLKVFLLGGEKGVAIKASENIKKKYPWIKITGSHHGYFNDSKDILKQINDTDLLLVGLGAPRQEQWIYENKDKIDSKVAIGVGGVIDILAGKTKRAPKFFQKLGLEWFYRLIKEPKRFFRALVIPKFMLIILFKRFFE